MSESINGLQKRVIDSRKAMHKSMAEVSTLNNELEARVKDRTQQLEQERDKAKLLAEIKTRFLANMSHEIRTPITIIKGFTEELLSEATGDTYRTLNRINQNTLHLQNVIDDILDTAKIEQGKMRIALESINLAHFMTDFIDSTAQMAHKNSNSPPCLRHLPKPIPARVEIMAVQDLACILANNLLMQWTYHSR